VLSDLRSVPPDVEPLQDVCQFRHDEGMEHCGRGAGPNLLQKSDALVGAIVTRQGVNEHVGIEQTIIHTG
jgi:hypothetical protein